MHNGVSIPRAALIFLSVLWLGLLLGVSFLATPVKFQAQSLSLPVALAVGQVTFALFSKVEWVVAILSSGCLLVAKPGRAEIVALLTVLIIVCAQALWLLPVLDGRLEAVIAGSPPPPSIHHRLYIAAEASKALALFVLSLAAFRGVMAGVRDPIRGPLAQVMERR